jgi:hypothetical protein
MGNPRPPIRWRIRLYAGLLRKGWANCGWPRECPRTPGSRKSVRLDPFVCRDKVHAHHLLSPAAIQRSASLRASFERLNREGPKEGSMGSLGHGSSKEKREDEGRACSRRGLLRVPPHSWWGAAWEPPSERSRPVLPRPCRTLRPCPGSGSRSCILMRNCIAT